MKKSHKKKRILVPENAKGRRVNDIRKRIVAIKEARGLSDEDISKRCNVSMFTLRRIARGVVKDPHPLTLEAIERFLNSDEGKA
jgi:ribosome-binding protein aMBF1 (putative translation factor)